MSSDDDICEEVDRIDEGARISNAKKLYRDGAYLLFMSGCLLNVFACGYIGAVVRAGHAIEAVRGCAPRLSELLVFGFSKSCELIDALVA